MLLLQTGPSGKGTEWVPRGGLQREDLDFVFDAQRLPHVDASGREEVVLRE